MTTSSKSRNAETKRANFSAHYPASAQLFQKANENGPDRVVLPVFQKPRTADPETEITVIQVDRGGGVFQRGQGLSAARPCLGCRVAADRMRSRSIDTARPRRR